MFAKSVYAVEPLKTNDIRCWNDGHWNYQWSGRISKSNNNEIRCRREDDGTYLVQDVNGVVWVMDEAEFKNFLANTKNAIVA